MFGASMRCSHRRPGGYPGIIAAVDFGLAAIVLSIGMWAKPGTELEVRTFAIRSLKLDAVGIKLALNSLGQDIRQTKNTVSGFPHDPLSRAAERLFAPAALSLLSGLRSRKKQAGQATAQLGPITNGRLHSHGWFTRQGSLVRGRAKLSDLGPRRTIRGAFQCRRNRGGL